MNSYEANKARGLEQEPGMDVTVHQRLQQHPRPCFCWEHHCHLAQDCSRHSGTSSISDPCPLNSISAPWSLWLHYAPDTFSNAIRGWAPLLDNFCGSMF